MVEAKMPPLPEIWQIPSGDSRFHKQDGPLPKDVCPNPYALCIIYTPDLDKPDEGELDLSIENVEVNLDMACKGIVASGGTNIDCQDALAYSSPTNFCTNSSGRCTKVIHKSFPMHDGLIQVGKIKVNPYIVTDGIEAGINAETTSPVFQAKKQDANDIKTRAENMAKLFLMGGAGGILGITGLVLLWKKLKSSTIQLSNGYIAGRENKEAHKKTVAEAKEYLKNGAPQMQTSDYSAKKEQESERQMRLNSARELANEMESELKDPKKLNPDRLLDAIGEFTTEEKKKEYMGYWELLKFKQIGASLDPDYRRQLANGYKILIEALRNIGK